MRIAIACDHGAYELKERVLNYLRNYDNDRFHLDLLDLGVQTSDSVDYPDMAQRLCQTILHQKAERGILMCGTGIGVSIAANRFPAIRAALCHDSCTARLSRLHNDANVLVMGGRTTGWAVAEEMVSIWLETDFEGERHQRRLDKIDSNYVSDNYVSD